MISYDQLCLAFTLFCLLLVVGVIIAALWSPRHRGRDALPPPSHTVSRDYRTRDQRVKDVRRGHLK
jgi:hypothetical protein